MARRIVRKAGKQLSVKAFSPKAKQLLFTKLPPSGTSTDA